MPTNSPRLNRNNRIPGDAVAEADSHNSSPTGAGLAHRHTLRLQPRSSVISSQLPAQGANPGSGIHWLGLDNNGVGLCPPRGKQLQIQNLPA